MKSKEKEKELQQNKTVSNNSNISKSKNIQNPYLNFDSEGCKNVVHEGIPTEPNNPWVNFNNKFNFEE